ncbi:hypothetical protein HXX76_010409 [Chlamydomonas incerta]|uniref:ditrans,polycis-polyprenyl diphosphate synthase [(2E,6E)-farnesyldiphosphate specific] n=1 Tax=Chlamydomonas incerta TaxID=51695 RepID=A0A835SFU2_CHLIN|nr:hypothetical protein HXX76_010409 [Chlamydomonas incerta]|eukprot:KAG2422628.1 hypothetical protein HXX76_010409 [Chlamydomonas incerta]
MEALEAATASDSYVELHTGPRRAKASQPLHSCDRASGSGVDGLHGVGASERSNAATKRVRVRVLSAADAYSPVLEAARRGGRCAGCDELLPLQGGPYREGLARLRGQLQQLAGSEVLLQPELVLVVGPALTLAGYPPFQVAASEILHIGPATQLCQSKVDRALAKYLRTEQRFGS